MNKKSASEQPRTRISEKKISPRLFIFILLLVPPATYFITASPQILQAIAHTEIVFAGFALFGILMLVYLRNVSRNPTPETTEFDIKPKRVAVFGSKDAGNRFYLVEIERNKCIFFYDLAIADMDHNNFPNSNFTLTIDNWEMLPTKITLHGKYTNPDDILPEIDFKKWLKWDCRKFNISKWKYIDEDKTPENEIVEESYESILAKLRKFC